MFASYWTDNDGIMQAIKNCNDKTGYIIDPHGAIGYQAWEEIKAGGLNTCKSNDYKNKGLSPNVPEWASKVDSKEAVGVILETASPAKFGQIVRDAIGKDPVIPERLEQIMRLPDQAIPMDNDYEKFKSWLLANL